MVREDHCRQVRISFEEAVIQSGLSKQRIYNLHSSKEHGRYPWKRGNAIGPYKIDTETFLKFIRTGERCGEEC